MVGYAPVSVIIPCFRCAETIGAALFSVWQQKLRPREVILVDDASGDSTSALLHALQDQYSSGWIKLITLRANGGPAVARNRGWDYCREPLIAFLDADDLWHPDKIAIQHEYMAAFPDLMLSGHDAEYVEELPGVPISDAHLALGDGEITQADVTGSPTMASSSAQTIPPPGCTSLALPDLLAGNPFVTPSVMLRRTVKRRFNPAFRYCEDYLLWLEICLDGGAVAHIHLPLVDVLRPPQHKGLSQNEFRMRWGFAGVYLYLWQQGRLPLGYTLKRSGDLYAKALLFRLFGSTLHGHLRRFRR